MINKMKIMTLVLLLSVVQLMAQQPSTLIHPNVRYGKLENGMTYYLMHNEEPKGRASFYIAHNVGALLEEDHQDGLAHMLEHLAFNGSENFKGKGVKNFLERQGVEFGSNINAYTAQDETVYNISNVPTDDPSVMDTCVLVLHDWSGSLTLAGEEIEAERGVIYEEWRQGDGARRRIQRKLAPTTMYQSKYAERDVIGSMDVVQNCEYSAIRTFYEKWYRPDLQAAIIIGDFDLDEMEARVQKILSRIPKAQNPAERTEYTIADNEGFLYDYATDAEATGVSYSYMIKQPAKTRAQKNDVEKGFKEFLLRSLYGGIMRERFGSIARKAEAPFMRARTGYFNFVRTMDAFMVSGSKPLNTDLMTSFKAVLLEYERVLRYGFTQSELERQKIGMTQYFEQQVKNKDRVNNDNYARGLVQNFMSNESFIYQDTQLEMLKKLLPTITPKDIHELAKSWYKEDNVVITIEGPEDVDFEYPTREEIAQLLKDVKAAELEGLEDDEVKAPLIAKEPTPGTVVKTKALEGTNAKEYTLSNDARVVILPTDKDDNEIQFTAWSKGGKSLIATRDIPTSGLAFDVAEASGLAGHTIEDLQKILVGKNISISPKLNTYSETISGGATPEDLETLLQLLYLTFEKPRFEKDPYDNSINRMKQQVKTAANNPRRSLQDSLTVAFTGGNLERNPLQSEELIGKVDFNRIEPIYRDRIKDAGDFVFVFVGAVDEQTLLPLVEKYIGSLSDSGRREDWKDHGIRPYKGGYNNTFAREMETPKQTNYISYFGETKGTNENSLVMQIAGKILSQRYFERIREQEGGSYGVRASGSLNRIPYERFSLTMSFDCNPDIADKLVAIIHEEVKNLTENAPTSEEFTKVIEGMKTSREEYLQKNDADMYGLMHYYERGYNSSLPEYYEDILDDLTVERFSKVFKKIMKKSDNLSVIMQPKKL